MNDQWMTSYGHSLATPGATIQTGGWGSAIHPGIIATATASAAWGTANLAIYLPFRISYPMTVTSLFARVGSANTGNIDVGIFDKGGTKLVSSGAVALGTTNTVQQFDVTDTGMGPGLYYFGVSLGNAAGTLFCWTLSSSSIGQVIGLAQEASAHALPATATLATYAQTLCPLVGALVNGTVM